MVNLTSATDLFQEAAKTFSAELQAFLLEQSEIKERFHGESYPMVIGPTHSWCPLDIDTRRIQSRLLSLHKQLQELAFLLLRNRPKIETKELTTQNFKITGAIEQTEPTYHKDTREALSVCEYVLRIMTESVNSLNDELAPSILLVPDTNALIYNPQLEEWQYEGLQEFTLVLTPQVISELDKLKHPNRSKSLKAKADKLIRQIKEYRRRGKITQGITLRKDRIKLMVIASEPNLKQTLSWLDRHHADDRILAGVIEVMRIYPRCQVALITRDINLQNKAEAAGVLPLDPPELKT